MRLTVTTPSGIVVDASEVHHVRAEDDTGSFGLLPHHTDLLTALAISVVTWRDGGREHYVAVRGGVLTMRGGDRVEIATREAQAGDDLDELEREVLARYRREAEAAAAASTEAARLETAIVRQILRYLRPRMAIPRFREEAEP